MKDVVVHVEGLNKKIGKNQILKNISFSLNKGEIVGFIGPNGAGKTTTMKCLCNLIYPDSGSIKIAGYDLLKERSKALNKIAALIESPGLYQDMSGKENVKLIANLRKANKQRVDEVLQFTKLDKALNKKVSTYSMGMKQRLALAIAIMNKPEFLILDEPTNGLDPDGVIQLRETMQSLIKTENMTILFSSHQLGEIEKLSDRIICINNGEIVPTPIALVEKRAYILETDNVGNAYDKLLNIVDQTGVKIVGESTLRILLHDHICMDELLKYMVTNSIKVSDLYKDTVDVETVYRQLYSDK